MKTINNLHNELGFEPINEVVKKGKPLTTHGGHRYEGIFCTGRFEGVHDYNKGFLKVKVSNPIDRSQPTLTITSVDDGVWNAYMKSSNPIDLAQFVKDFKDTFGVILPPARELNAFLAKYNMYGINES